MLQYHPRSLMRLSKFRFSQASNGVKDNEFACILSLGLSRSTFSASEEAETKGGVEFEDGDELVL
ncbi:hypothetical protein MUK42_25355 [Musa troglodytarum]|uniref:Uncharacterized protein n=1 Tax=Musa troglodytarum TaxID=320322 RepID=A0A9E7F4H0_9LILI|nr:hypothetical protein MUK42_25355 [Musa troglodytarum]